MQLRYAPQDAYGEQMAYRQPEKQGSLKTLYLVFRLPIYADAHPITSDAAATRLSQTR
ncbi:hypothetical protein [Kingella sp. (in: b-proteobacteria)]|uniref:hypothetical protein n=1 Tax=Kingella sp. (in: b-proteobacteria) TaxID=2020713 RepID=UPI0026DD4316|nr:hypothetical protein [Kingella sp. (in: b-proteobacteria)]MDO4658168.1 hypothetical protein [Kingella sp. (in: b-proteobacteria)]